MRNESFLHITVKTAIRELSTHKAIKDNDSKILLENTLKGYRK